MTLELKVESFERVAPGREAFPEKCRAPAVEGEPDMPSQCVWRVHPGKRSQQRGGGSRRGESWITTTLVCCAHGSDQAEAFEES